MRKNILDSFPKGQTPRAEQAQALKELEEAWDNYDVFVVEAPVACHEENELVLLYSGECKPIKDIEVGMELMGPDSKPRVVLNKTVGVSELYEICPKRGQSYWVTKDHIWPILEFKRFEEKSVRTGYFSILERTTSDLLRRSKDRANNQFLIKHTGLDFSTKVLSLPPYILGLWLGDGSSTASAITTIDREIEEVWARFAEDLNLGIRVNTKAMTAATTRFITGRRKTSNTMLKCLRDMNLYGNKHIPLMYLTADRDQRLELLAGIIDTDGYVCSKHNSIEVTFVNERLLDDLLQLVWGLGFSASKHTKLINGKPYYRIHISGKNVMDIPLRIKYKKQALQNSKSNQSNRKFYINPIPRTGNFVGLKVSADSLFLLGDHTITHNCGKSAVSVTIAAWANTMRLKSNIVVPTNILLRQYTAAYPRLFSLERKSHYRCKCLPDFVEHKQANCDYYHKVNGEHCPDCNYIRMVRQAHTMPFGIMNQHVLLAHKLNKNVLIADEAHTLESLIRSLAARRLWRKDYGWPSYVSTYGTLFKWLQSLPAETIQQDSKLKALWDELESGKLRHLVEWGVEEFRGGEEECLKLLPIDISQEKPLLWPHKKTQKIVLLSATISKVDIDALGLSAKRVKYIQTQSPIAPQQRPVVYYPVVNMSYEYQENNIPRLAELLKTLASSHERKGMVHVTYTQAEMLKDVLQDDTRFMFHGREDKLARYQEWRDSHVSDNKVFIASGLQEGIDLAGPEYTWQVIAKIPYPSLEEPAYKYMALETPSRYIWETLRTTAQATGRICRGPADYGVTYIVDSQFQGLLQKARAMQLVPKWLEESIEAGVPYMSSMEEPPENAEWQ